MTEPNDDGGLKAAITAALNGGRNPLEGTIHDALTEQHQIAQNPSAMQAIQDVLAGRNVALNDDRALAKILRADTLNGQTLN